MLPCVGTSCILQVHCKATSERSVKKPQNKSPLQAPDREADRLLSTRRYFQIRKLCLRASKTGPRWHMKKWKELLTLILLQTCIIWMHYSLRSQDGPDWASRPVPADVATHVLTHSITQHPQEPDCCPMKSRAVNETLAAWSIILRWWLRFWRLEVLGGVVAAKTAKRRRLKRLNLGRQQLDLIQPLIIFLRTFSETQEITDSTHLAFFALWKSQASTDVLHLVLMGHNFKKFVRKQNMTGLWKLWEDEKKNNTSRDFPA